jgi:tRNA(fMet)-specific endonuclease VapC
MYMLDTNICIYIIKKRPLSVLNRFSTIPRDEICISVVTLAELRYGIEKSSSKRFNQRILDDFLLRLTVLYWDENAAMQYGKTRAFLEKKGLPIGNMDLLISVHALSQKHILVSNNLGEFERVPDLRYENWV